MTDPTRRLLTWTLAIVGFVALVLHTGRFEQMDAWGWLSLVTLAAAPIVRFPDRGGWRWGLASLPFWAYGNSAEWILVAAAGLTVAAMVALAVGPTLVGRGTRRRTLVPMPQLAAGPLTAITPREFPAARRSRPLAYVTIVLAVSTVVLFGASATTGDQSFVAFGLVTTIMGSTCAFAQWFSGRVRLRVDGVGVHGRTMFREHSARWTEIAALHLRYVLLPGAGIRMVYYVVVTPRAEVAFPSSMTNAQDLQAIIEAATGVRWAQPEVTPTM